MSSRRIARALASAAGAACASSLVACGLLYGFDRYDTDVAPVHDGSVAAEAATPADFDLVVTGALRVEPGTSAPLTVGVKRRGATSERIVVTMTDPLPVGLERAVSATLEPGVSSTSLPIAVRPDAPGTTQTLHLTATSTSVAHTKDAALTFRGAACAADHSFSPNATGTLRITSSGGAAVRSLGLSADGDTITLALPSEGIFRLDAKGALAWNVGVEPDAIGFAVDPMHGVIFATPSVVTRRGANGADDLFYGLDGSGTGTVRPPCSPTTITQRSSETSVVCVENKGEASTLLRYDGAGLQVSSDTVHFGVGHEVTMNASTGVTGGGVVACGRSVEGALGSASSATFVRWLSSGRSDDAFGVGGRVVLGNAADALACATDDAGVVGLGTVGDELSLLALTATGAADGAFGIAGAQPLRLGASMRVEAARFALDTGGILAVVSAGSSSFVLRFLRDGRVDTSFGNGGSCALGLLALPTVASIAVSPGGKLLVLSTATTQALLARIWL